MWATASSQRIPHRQPLLPLSSLGCFPRHPRKHAHLHASSLALLPTPSQRLPAALHPPTPSLALPSLPGRRPALLPSARARWRVRRGLRRGCRLSNPFCSPNGARNLGTGVSGDDPPTEPTSQNNPPPDAALHRYLLCAQAGDALGAFPLQASPPGAGQGTWVRLARWQSHRQGGSVTWEGFRTVRKKHSYSADGTLHQNQHALVIYTKTIPRADF